MWISSLLSSNQPLFKKTTTVAIALVFGLLLTSCSTDGNAAESDEETSSSSDSDHDHGHHDHDSHGHDEDMEAHQSTMAASEIKGAHLLTGALKALTSAPESAKAITGTAWLARHTEGSTVTLDVSGLSPEKDYMAHLHEQSCSNGGGPHFKFDPNGSDKPPNEIHLTLTADSDGKATTTVANENTNSQGATSVMVHQGSEALVCADLQETSPR